MSFIRITVRLSLFIITTITLAPVCLVVLIALFFRRERLGPAILKFYSAICLKIFRVEIEYSWALPEMDTEENGMLLVANHTTLLDIFILSKLYKALFVSKIDVLYYPVIGQAAWLMGIIFLKRKSKKSRKALIRTIARRARGKIITIFPQGGTSSQKDPLPFKCGIFKSVEMNHELLIVPVTIYYRESSRLAWTGGKTVFGNLVDICALPEIYVRVFVSEAISIRDYFDKSISEVCREAEESVLEKL